MPDVIEYAERFKAALIAKDLQSERRLIAAYRGIYATVRAEVDALVLAIAQTEEPTAGQVARMKRYGRLLSDIEQQLTGYSAFARSEMGAAARLAVTMGADDARVLAAVALGDAQFAARLRALHPDAIEQLLGFLDPDGPLYQRLGHLPKWTAEQVSRAILDGVGLGRNPRAIAREITRSLGMGLTESLRMTRTVQIYAYREATRASYLANSDVVTGWIWWANLSGACPACIAMHGTEHPLSEKLDDHHNGRCTPLPKVIGSTNKLAGAGERYFNELPEAEQRKLLGPGKYDAYKAGKFSFSQLATTHTDAVYGEMRSVASLSSLVGD
jgi:hypothetical protein